MLTVDREAIDSVAGSGFDEAHVPDPASVGRTCGVDLAEQISGLEGCVRRETKTLPSRSIPVPRTDGDGTAISFAKREGVSLALSIWAHVE